MNELKRNLEIAKQNYIEAKRDVYEAIFERVKQGDCFAFEISDDLDLDMPTVVGALQSYDGHRNHIARPSTVEKVYVRVRPDGTIDEDDTVSIRYRAHKYISRI